MGRRQVELFCTTRDFINILEVAEEALPMSFAVAGLFETRVVRSVHTSADVLNFMVASSEVALAFLAVGRGVAIEVRKVPQKKGGCLYAVDQVDNQRSVMLRPGRMVDERTLLAGQIGTVSDDPASVSLFLALSRAVRRRFVRVRSYWVGTEAIHLLETGGRLIAALKAPPEYDLRR